VNCSACKGRLGAYLDGDLSRRDAALIDAHLAKCAECRSEKDRLQAVESSLIRLVGIDPHPDFTLAVMVRIAAIPVPARQQVRLWWLVAADILLWAAIGALTAFGAIKWRSIAVAAGTLTAKLGIASSALYDVAQHLHLTLVIALGVGVEIAFLALFFVAGRKYLSRIRATMSGVLS
jgi:anti-sigma factor RsiW